MSHLHGIERASNTEAVAVAVVLSTNRYFKLFACVSLAVHREF
jgi:hypothetical protein